LAPPPGGAFFAWVWVVAPGTPPGGFWNIILGCIILGLFWSGASFSVPTPHKGNPKTILRKIFHFFLLFLLFLVFLVLQKYLFLSTSHKRNLFFGCFLLECCFGYLYLTFVQ
jgi:cytochrome b561